jgi:membrane dipeptidase
MRRGWSDGDVAKVAGENVLRVMAACERVAATLRAARPPSETLIEATRPR